jgi:phage/plasmid-like protein (TIGR03299 family)
MDYYDEGYGFGAFKPAWHHKMPVLNFRPVGWAEAARHANLDWDIESVPVFRGTEYESLAQVSNYQLIVRDDKDATDPEAILHVAKSSYTPITNAEFGEIIEFIWQGAGLGIKPEFETLISLKGGRVIACTLILGDKEISRDSSPIRQYIAGFTSHDGSSKLRIGNTDVRIVCANTQNAANADFEGSGRFGEIMHTPNWRDMLPKVTEQVRHSLDTAEKNIKLYDEMSTTFITTEQMHDFISKYVAAEIKRIYRDRKPDIEIVEKTSRKISNSFLDVYDGALGSGTMEGIRGTKWGLYQAVTQMRDHHTAHHGLSDGNYDTLIGRTLLYGDAPKNNAMKILAKV